MKDMSHREFSKNLDRFIGDLSDLRAQRALTLSTAFTPFFDLPDEPSEECVGVGVRGMSEATTTGGLKRKSSQRSDDEDSEVNSEERRAALLAEPGVREKRTRYPKGKGPGRGVGPRKKLQVCNNEFNNEQVYEITAMGFVEMNLDNQNESNPSVPPVDLEVARRLRSKMTRAGLLRGEEKMMSERLFYLGSVSQARPNRRTESYRGCADRSSFRLFPPQELEELADTKAGVAAMGKEKRATFLKHSIIDGSSLYILYPVLKSTAHQKAKQRYGYLPTEKF
jgi:hypothetical protein